MFHVEHTIQRLSMSTQKDIYLTCEDYTVSNKKFDLLYNSNLDMLETFPQPKEGDLAQYYESENYISHTDSKKSFIDKLYQIVKKHTLKNKLKLINSFETEGKNILDIGCGTGDFLSVCKRDAWNVVGIEPNEKARTLANIKLFGNSPSQVLSDVIQINSKKFDVITLWHVLEHIPDLATYISTLKMLLKPTGVLVVAVPNFKSYDAAYYKQFWAAFDVPRHLWHFSQKAIQLLFSKAEMKLVKIIPMKFDAFYVSLLSEKNKNGNTNYLKAFFVGFLSNIKALKTKEYSSLIYLIKNG